MQEEQEQVPEKEQATEQEVAVETTTEQNEEQVQEETTQEVETSEEQQSETETESQTDDTQETKEAQPKDDEYIFKLKNKEEEIVLDVRNPEHRKQLEENARKGIDYTKKTQLISELEQNLRDQQSKVASLQSDPDFVRLGIAKQMNIPAEVLFQNPQPPNEAMKDYAPTEYIQAYNSWDLAVKQKQLVENTFQMLQKQNSDSINQALVKRARLKYDDVGEKEFTDMLNWASQRFQPDPRTGVYPEDSLDIAYKQLFGEKKMEETKLKLSNNFNKKIQEAVKQKPVKTVNQRVQKPAESTEKQFLDFVTKKKGSSYYD